MEGGIDASSAGSSTHLRANFFFASTPKLASVKVMSGLALRWSSPKVLCGGHAAPQRPKSVDGGQHTPHGTPYPSGANDVGQARICLSSGSCWVGGTSRMPGSALAKRSAERLLARVRMGDPFCPLSAKIGRASCRARVGKYGE